MQDTVPQIGPWPLPAGGHAHRRADGGMYAPRDRLPLPATVAIRADGAYAGTVEWHRFHGQCGPGGRGWLRGVCACGGNPASAARGLHSAPQSGRCTRPGALRARPRAAGTAGAEWVRGCTLGVQGVLHALPERSRPADSAVRDHRFAAACLPPALRQGASHRRGGVFQHGSGQTDPGDALGF